MVDAGYMHPEASEPRSTAQDGGGITSVRTPACLRTASVSFRTTNNETVCKNGKTDCAVAGAYTRRRFGGRQPLCGIGVTSVIETTCMPAVCSARIAASRPEPGPRT